MQEHCYGQYPEYPEQINAVIEIPKTKAMRTKWEVNPANGNVSAAQKLDKPIPTYWHYGAVPLTVSDDLEPADVVIFTKNEDAWMEIGTQMAVRPVGIFNVSDGWEIYDHKIIAVPASKDYEHIHSIADLPAVPNPGKKTPKKLLENFFTKYRSEDKNVVKNGWGSKEDAIEYLKETRKRYQNSPKEKLDEKNQGNYFNYSNRVFITPPPPASYAAEKRVGDTLLQMEEGKEYTDPDYGKLYPKETVREAMREIGVNRGRSQLNGLDRNNLIREKLELAKNLEKAGAKAYTISNDKEWVECAQRAGIKATLVNDPNHEVVHVEGLSGQSVEVLHFRKNNLNVVIASSHLKEQDLRTRLSNLGVIQKNEKMVVLHPPSELIPYEIPNSKGETLTLLSDWIDFGFGILPDSNNEPRLFISESIKKVAHATGKEAALEQFIKQCSPYFKSVDFVGCTNKYGAPTNFIDTGTTIIAPNCISDEGKTLVEKRLHRELVKSPCAEHVNIGQPGPRCASFPIKEVTYNLLREKGLLELTGAKSVDELYDPTSGPYAKLIEQTQRHR